MKKLLSLILAVVLLASLCVMTSSCGEKEEEALTKITVIYHPTFGGSTAIGVADALGYFEDEGLDVTFVMFTSGPPEIAAMAAGQAQFGFIGSGAAWLAFSGQVDIIALDNIALTEEIIVRADSGINSITDLRGKRIAVQEGAAGYTLLLVALQANGMSVSDVTIINTLNDNIASTYNSEDIDCWAGWMPATTNLKSALGDNAKVLANNASYPTASFPSTWVANKDYVAEHPDVCQKFVNALTRAQVFRAENQDLACAYASTKANQATNDLTEQIGTAVFPTLEQFDNYYNTTAFVDMLTQLKEVQSAKVTGSLAISEVYVDTFAKQAVANLKSGK